LTVVGADGASFTVEVPVWATFRVLCGAIGQLTGDIPSWLWCERIATRRNTSLVHRRNTSLIFIVEAGLRGGDVVGFSVDKGSLGKFVPPSCCFITEWERMRPNARTVAHAQMQEFLRAPQNHPTIQAGVGIRLTSRQYLARLTLVQYDFRSLAPSYDSGSLSGAVLDAFALVLNSWWSARAVRYHVFGPSSTCVYLSRGGSGREYGSGRGGGASQRIGKDFLHISKLG
jgi:hypothetical protein